ncbi:MAG: hypothetical protein AAGB30_10960 [Pedobacter sp.]
MMLDLASIPTYEADQEGGPDGSCDEERTTIQNPSTEEELRKLLQL